MGADRVSGLFWLGFGLLCVYGSVLLGLGTLREPGTGFFPFLSGCFFALLAFVVLVRSFDAGTGVSSENLVFLEGAKLASAARRGIVDFGLYSDVGKGGFFAHFSYSSFLHA